jgi:hypothetical protein
MYRVVLRGASSIDSNLSRIESVPLKTAAQPGVTSSWCYRWEGRPDLPERARSYDVGADLYAAVTASGGGVTVMPGSFGRAYIHVGGLSWIDSATGRQGVVRRTKRALVAAGLQVARLTSLP